MLMSQASLALTSSQCTKFYEKRWKDFGERFRILGHIKTFPFFSFPKADRVKKSVKLSPLNVSKMATKLPNLFKSIAIAMAHSITSRQQFSHK